MPSQRKQSEASRRVKKTIEEKSFDNRQTSQSLESRKEKNHPRSFGSRQVFPFLLCSASWRSCFTTATRPKRFASAPAKPNPEGKPKKKARARPAAEKSSSANQSLHPLFRKRASFGKTKAPGEGSPYNEDWHGSKKRQSPSGEWKSQRDTQAMTALA